MPLIEPPELQNYKLLELVGCGGMGSVYIARQLNSDKLVAVKFLSPDVADNPAILKQFKQEGEIIQQLKHPNIVGFVEQGVAKGNHYIIMDYVKGISLDNFPLSYSVKTEGQAQPSMEEYLNIFIGCFEALRYIHKKGLVHRDIKPQNIVLRGEKYTPCLLDFGIANFVDKDDDLNINPDRMFTVSYASPEQLTNKPIDALSDLFSFGVVMYEKLTGKIPFKGTKAMEVFLEQTKWNFPPPRQFNSKVPKKLEQIILKLLAKDPVFRYPSADAVISELKRVLEIAVKNKNGLKLSNIISDIKGITFHKSSFKKITLSDEQALLKKQKADIVEARNRLKLAVSSYPIDKAQIAELKELCKNMQEEYTKLEKQMKMALGFKSQPIVIDKFNSIFKMESIAFEKRGIPFTINTLEQRLTTNSGEDIVIGSLNFSEVTKHIYANKKKNNSVTWDSEKWFFGPYEEKDFPIMLMIGDKSMPRPPKEFKGFFWPIEFLIAVKKLGWTGVAVQETFKGIDRGGCEVHAEHKETILFSQTLFDKLITSDKIPKK